jgi:poly-gamma-glutamate synthesis protein (capsule biosynthesis protein)
MARVAVILVFGSLVGLAAFRVVAGEPAAGADASGPTTAPTAPSTTLPPPTTVVASATTTTTTPAVTTTTTPATAEPAAPDRGWLVIQGAGDTSFDPSYVYTLATEGYGYAFEGLDGLFLEDDLTVVNLECTPSELGTPLDKAFVFRCDPDALPIALENGIDVANLANNHSGDYGTAAMVDGAEQVRASGIAPVGVGADLADATAPALFHIKGWTIAVLGMGGVVPGPSWLATEDRPGMASGDDTEQMVTAVRAAAEVADLVVVSIHWGWELETTPRADDRARAEAMVEAGADIVFGHHPHRLGEVEYIDGKPVFWTLGNFVWPYLSVPSATTAVGRVVVSPDGALDACLIPAFIERSGQPVLQGPPPCAVPVDFDAVAQHLD